MKDRMMSNAKHRSRSSAPPPPNLANKTSGTRRKQPLELPPLDAPRAAQTDPELETRLFKLVTAVQQREGMEYPPAWLDVVHAAKVRGYVEERGLKLYLRKHGEQFLSDRGGEETARGGRAAASMTPMYKHTRLLLKDLAREQGVSMLDALTDIIAVIHENRDALTRAAQRAGADHPWEAVRTLLRGK